MEDKIYSKKAGKWENPDNWGRSMEKLNEILEKLVSCSLEDFRRSSYLVKSTGFGVNEAKTAIHQWHIDKVKELVGVLEFCKGAIEDAIYLEDGLDGGTGEKVLKMIAKAIRSSILNKLLEGDTND